MKRALESEDALVLVHVKRARIAPDTSPFDVDDMVVEFATVMDALSLYMFAQTNKRIRSLVVARFPAPDMTVVVPRSLGLHSYRAFAYLLPAIKEIKLPYSIQRACHHVVIPDAFFLSMVRGAASVDALVTFLRQCYGLVLIHVGHQHITIAKLLAALFVLDKTDWLYPVLGFLALNCDVQYDLTQAYTLLLQMLTDERHLILLLHTIIPLTVDADLAMYRILRGSLLAKSHRALELLYELITKREFSTHEWSLLDNLVEIERLVCVSVTLRVFPAVRDAFWSKWMPLICRDIGTDELAKWYKSIFERHAGLAATPVPTPETWDMLQRLHNTIATTNAH